MSSCFFVDVSCDQYEYRSKLSTPSIGEYNDFFCTDRFIVRGRDYRGNYSIFDPLSKTNYVSYIIRSIHLCGEAFTKSDYGSDGMFYVILYKTCIYGRNDIHLYHPGNNGTKKQWSFYLHPETVLTYKTLKIGDEDEPDKNHSVRIDLFYNKPVLVRPDDVITVEYVYLTYYDEFTNVDFNTEVSAEVHFDLV